MSETDNFTPSPNVLGGATNGARDFRGAVEGEVGAKVDQALQRRRGALHVVVVDHNLAKHLRGVEPFEKVPAARLLAGGVAAGAMGYR